MRKILVFLLPLLLAFAIISCSPETESTPYPTLQNPSIPSERPTRSGEIPLEKVFVGTTQNNFLGNHYVNGRIDLQTANVLDIPLNGEPHWLVSGPVQNGVLFVVVFVDGKTQGFIVSGEAITPVAISPVQLPAGTPPYLIISNEKIQLLPPPEGASDLTSPILVNDQVIYIAANGDLVMDIAGIQTRLSVNALPDGRILTDENHRLLFLTHPTKLYDHGVLGDDLEAAGITLVETQPSLTMIRTIMIDPPDVIEGIAPIWEDLNEDGIREILVTLSNKQSGARLAVFQEDGTLLAESPAIGTGYRWRHQLAVASFDASARPLVVSIRTPHIGGVVEFFQLDPVKLEMVAEIPGFSSHTLGSRNLDTALVGDFNHDGNNELLAPDQAHLNLGILSTDGMRAVIPLDGMLTSNLSASVINGNIVLGAGTSGNLRIWMEK